MNHRFGAWPLFCLLTAWILGACASGDPDASCADGTSPKDEVCDGVDNDCDGVTDEDLAAPACEEQGVCAGATAARTCEGADGWSDCAYGEHYEASAEVTCDGFDNDCDGSIDDALEPPACDEPDQGACEGATAARTCEGADGWSDCDYGEDYEATAEVSCDGHDNDCDGSVDDALEPPPCDEPDQGACAGATAARTCGGAGGWDACDYGERYEADAEVTCDDFDNDCDGEADETDDGQLPVCLLPEAMMVAAVVDGSGNYAPHFVYGGRATLLGTPDDYLYSPYNMFTFNGQYYFAGYDVGGNSGLYTVDPFRDPAAPTRAFDLGEEAGDDELAYQVPIVMGDHVYFAAVSDVSGWGQGLYRWDGTGQPTLLLNLTSSVNQAVPMGTDLITSSADTTTYSSPVRIDTTTGTVTELQTTRKLRATILGVIGTVVYMNAAEMEVSFPDHDLWAFDTALPESDTNPWIVHDFIEGEDNSGARPAFQTDNHLYLYADTTPGTVTGYELFAFDGTDLTQLSDVPDPERGGFPPSGLVLIDGYVYGVQGWGPRHPTFRVNDTTLEYTYDVLDTGGDQPNRGFVEHDGQIYFGGSHPDGTRMLYRSSDGETPVAVGGDGISDLFSVGGELYVGTDTGNGSGIELHTVADDGTLVLVQDLYPGAGDSWPYTDPWNVPVSNPGASE